MAAEFKDNLWYLEIFHDTHMVTATLNRRIILCLNLISYMKVGDGVRGVPKSTHGARETDHACQN